MNICIVAGARPNFMKIAPIIEAITDHNKGKKEIIKYLLVHTGQHYDEKMSKLFFDELGIPKPDINLEVGSGSHARQTAEIMKKFEEVCLTKRPTHVMVVGDVNSTIACALVGSKLGIKIIHVEAGLRSFDRSMPEEINRVLTDAISDILFTTERSANKNLRNEGISNDKIHFVGNVMIDTLLKHRKGAEQSNILHKFGLNSPEGKWEENQVSPFAVLTLHRPSNVDEKENFQEIIEGLKRISKQIRIIFPVHPRTLDRIKKYGFERYFEKLSGPRFNSINKKKFIYWVDPLGYLDFLQLMSNAKLVLTDSGGIQEETTILKVPCVTLRENTERPITVTHGTNMIAGVKKEDIINAALGQMNGTTSSGEVEKRRNKQGAGIPPLWDGKAAERIVNILVREI